MRTYKKILFSKYAESQLAWRNDRKAKTHIKLVLYFDFKEGVRFTASAGSVSQCCRNPFKALFRVLEHESIGMAKYDYLKDDTRRKGLWQKL